tara:strand:+ start:2572 stop:4473 length:1902 start_codon:yes stop_codon:yes gene_type:complete
MNKFLFTTLLILNFLFSYENLYLMEFDNISRDSKLDSFSQNLPTYIINNFSNLEYLNILYAPRIIPTIYEENSDLNNGILINGRFLSSYDNIIISFDAFDVDTWEKKTYRSYYCKLNDNECIEQALRVCINDSILPLFCPFYDCLGKCNGTAKIDCLGECDGLAHIDCEGTCNGNAELDCKGTCWGSATLDNCGICDYDITNDCLEDCKGTWGGDAHINKCNICVSKEMDESSGMDCLGVCGGDTILDCNGECNGTAFMNECNVCVGGNSNNNVNLGMDCYGICYGSTLLDACGVCGGDNSSCSDCMGDPNGNAILDNCEKCDYDTSNDCIQDCNGSWGGLAFLNECSVCVGGETNFSIDKGLDCNRICWGNAKLDDCGICNGNNNCSESNMINQNLSLVKGDFLKKNIKKIHNDIDINPLSGFKKLKDYENISENTSYLLKMLDGIKESLYKVDILNVKKETVNNEINLTIPVEYSISNEFISMFSSIPYAKKENSNGTVIYEINKDYFNVDEDLNSYLSLMNYQIIPVLFLVDSNNKIERIIIDTWNSNSYNLNAILSKGIKVDFSNQFSPFISITPGKASIQFNFQLNVLQNEYELLLSQENYLDYQYVLVDFFYHNNLTSDLSTYLLNY